MSGKAARQKRWLDGLRARAAALDLAREAIVTLACAVLDARTLDEAQAAALRALGRGPLTDKEA